MMFDIEEIKETSLTERLIKNLAEEFDLVATSCLIKKRTIYVSLKLTFKDGSVAIDNCTYKFFKKKLTLKNINVVKTLNSKGKYKGERIYFHFPIFEEGDENYCFLYDLFKEIRDARRG